MGAHKTSRKENKTKKVHVNECPPVKFTHGHHFLDPIWAPVSKTCKEYFYMILHYFQDICKNLPDMVSSGFTSCRELRPSLRPWYKANWTNSCPRPYWISWQRKLLPILPLNWAILVSYRKENSLWMPEICLFILAPTWHPDSHIGSYHSSVMVSNPGVD